MHALSTLFITILSLYSVLILNPFSLHMTKHAGQMNYVTYSSKYFPFSTFRVKNWITFMIDLSNSRSMSTIKFKKLYIYNNTLSQVNNYTHTYVYI